MALAVDSQMPSQLLIRSASPDSFAFNNVAGTLMCAFCIATDQTGTVTLNAPTYNGATLTIVGSQVSTDTAHTKLGLYRLFTPATGSNTFTVTGSGGSGNFQLHAGIITFTGADIAGTPFGTPVTATGNSGTSATGNITNTSGNILIAGVATGSSIPTIGTGNTLSCSKAGSGNTGGDNSGVEYWAASGTTRNMQFTQTSDIWGILGVEVLAAGGAATTRGMPFETRSTAFNGGRTFRGPLAKEARLWCEAEYWARLDRDLRRAA